MQFRILPTAELCCLLPWWRSSGLVRLWCYWTSGGHTKSRTVSLWTCY